MTDQSLTSFIEEVCGDSHLRVEDDLGDGFVRLRIAEAERRQARHDIRSTEDIVIEMLRNARDAGARSIFVSLSREGSARRICMIDDGAGIPESMQDAIFEPRVTSKLDTVHMDKWGVHGRGMALFSIAENAEIARVAVSAPEKGAALFVETNLDRLPEKTDQSSMPVFSHTDEGEIRVRGPRNINRMVGEFAFEHRETVSVYSGAPVEIAATLYEYGNATVSASTRAFASDPADLPVMKRLCLSADPAEFAAMAQGIGLDISERSARRIMDGGIAVLDPVSETLAFEERSAAKRRKAGKKALAADARGLKIDRSDIDAFSDGMRDAFAELAQRYYLEPDVRPEIHVSRDGIHVNFPISKLL
ncbi:ATP-binding protein [Raoultibacter massiliensis]|uniref:ATP-binding protein n=1 Tax=Raoultibacter massiliensis TaxID=1852371 RepID=UPI000C849675|nr:ATP-binding protein [Raoultibacter massiliensis]